MTIEIKPMQLIGNHMVEEELKIMASSLSDFIKINTPT